MRILVCSLIFFSCVDNDTLNRVCSVSCYSGSEKTRDKGVCKSGKILCDAIGNEILDEYGEVVCSGESLPESSEICDGKDNDCDGRVDEGIGDRRSYYFDFPDKNPCINWTGECANALVRCVYGTYICDYSYPGTIELGNETRCDGKDNDCDGRIDENIFDDLSLNDRICYDGVPIETLSNPPCRAGLLECIRGEVICRNEIVPSLELCDEIDNDCNGFVDDTGDVLLKKYDIVFIVDTSGSMCEEIAAVANATSAYAEQFDGNSNFRFALVIMSDSVLPFVRVDTNFTDFSTIRNRLLSLGCNGGGQEASLDSMYYTCDLSNNILNLFWRDDANYLFFMFTDEPQQSYISPRITGQSIIDTCMWSGMLPFIWSKYPADFEYIADGANGIHFSLTTDWQIILNDMNSVILTLCGSGG